MRTHSRLAGLVVLGMTFCAASSAQELKVGAPTALGDRTATLKRLDDLPLVDSEYSRLYRFDSFDNPKLTLLRERYRLDEVVAPGKDEFDRQILLMDWTHRRFKSFGRPSTPARGALEILAAIDEGHRFFCTQYAQVLVSAAASLGWVDRPLALRRHRGVNAVGGSTEHTTTEIWSNQHRKWVMLDPTSNLWIERRGVPLNAWEIREEWFRNDGKELVFVVGRERKRHRKPDLPIVLGRFDGFGELSFQPDELDKYGFIGYVPNTDLMDSGFAWGPMFIVKDELCEGTRWHTRKAPERPATDPYFPIGQSAITLEARDGEVAVSLRTLTPNLARFEIRVDGGEWKSAEETFEWSVDVGTRRLAARTVNAFGVTGPVSTVELEVTR